MQMPPTLVDSNVIIDLLKEETQWINWTRNAIEKALKDSTLVVNPIIYAEISASFSNASELDKFLSTNLFQKEYLPYDAAFVAGQSYRLYKKQNRGKIKASVMPDFYIGAHADVMGWTLLTRDKQTFKPYFPNLQVISP